MNRSTPRLPVHHQLPEFTQIHVHRVGDAIQPFHPLSSPFPPAPNPITFVGKVISLLFNMLSRLKRLSSSSSSSRLIITFLPRSKCLLISWLQSPSAVILERPKMKSATVSTIFPSIFHEVMGLKGCY